MQRFEYKVVPAPRRGEKARGVKSTEDRFALALSTVMNELGAEGWDYIRADALPCDERSGLTGTKTSFQNMLVFRRALEAPRAPVFVRQASAAAEAVAPPPQEPAEPVAAADPAVVSPVLHAQPRQVNSAPALGPARPEMAAE
ncbi:DUF4177 domain-containing protein [Pseudogemmobacter bohemicus]|uniref:DUF4177 domain-containing protein n=1 Tax=Pseudogemmobacter bohemicus TaxID=2250708 RepID=UPI000DD3C2FD|nr:DUF4177 domain-containing protein [Pseudogemmobacter bohemicus]